MTVDSTKHRAHPAQSAEGLEGTQRRITILPISSISSILYPGTPKKPWTILGWSPLCDHCIGACTDCMVPGLVTFCPVRIGGFDRKEKLGTAPPRSPTTRSPRPPRSPYLPTRLPSPSSNATCSGAIHGSLAPTASHLSPCTHLSPI